MIEHGSHGRLAAHSWHKHTTRRQPTGHATKFDRQGCHSQGVVGPGEGRWQLGKGLHIVHVPATGQSTTHISMVEVTRTAAAATALEHARQLVLPAVHSLLAGLCNCQPNLYVHAT
jgi:hypothetical protein